MSSLMPSVAHALKVEVGLLYDLPIAKSVATEPLTPDDWEILVRVDVMTSSLVPHLFSGITCRTRRIHTSISGSRRPVRPGGECLGTRPDSYPSTCSYVVAYFFHPHNTKVISVSFEPSSAKAVLLTNDTELSVAPKTRRQWNSEKNIVNGENPVMKSDPSPTARTPSHTVLLRVLPASMFSDHLPSLLDFGSVIFVSQRMLSVARLQGLLPSDPKTTLIADVKRLDPPTDPAGAANPSPSDATPIAKVLNPSEATKREDVKEELSKVGHVRVVGIDCVLEGQMVVVGDVDGVGDWDVVRQVLSGRRNVSQDS